MGSAKKLQRRGAPRYKPKDERNFIRFKSKQHKNVHTTRIFDISETGISFTTSRKLVPAIGTTLIMEFMPVGGIQIAITGKIVRIEEPGPNSRWAKFPGTVKVGLTFINVPPAYKRVISDGLHDAFERETSEHLIQQPIDVSPRRKQKSWLAENVWTVVGAVIILAFTGFAAYVLVDSSSRGPATDAPWASQFFEKVIPKNP